VNSKRQTQTANMTKMRIDDRYLLVNVEFI